MKLWMKQLIGSMCLINLLLQLSPDNHYQKYIKFYAGLLFLLVFIKPVSRFIAEDNYFEEALHYQLLKEESFETLSASEGLLDLKSFAIEHALRAEFKRIIQETVESYDMKTKQIEVEFDRSENWKVRKVYITLEKNENQQVQKAAKGISDILSVDLSNIIIN